MKRRFFGTDGVRGRFGGPVMNPDFVRRLAFAAAKTLHPAGNPSPVAVVGRDTRASGEILEAAVCEGLGSAGWRVEMLGIVPTPAVALAARDSEAALGVVLTASHNPADDNGVKFFRGTGMKLDDATELRIEGALPEEGWRGAPVGRVAARAGDGCGDYVARMVGLLAENSLASWQIVLDCANGATCGTSPEVLRKLGANLTLIGCKPDGANINAGVGSEHPELLSESVKRHGARLGIAHDGDGDRVVLCDEKGVVLDGDEVLTFLACHALGNGRLDGGVLVVTMQSNLGVDAAIRAAGGRVVRTDIGDRHVMAGMIREGASLGGESSGHVIFSKVSPTGDGLVAALEVVRVMIATGKPLSELRRALVRFPQSSEAIRVEEKIPITECPAISSAIREAGEALGSEGRVLVRYSGTEPKIRLLVEGRSEGVVTEWMTRLRDAVGRDLQTVRD